MFLSLSLLLSSISGLVLGKGCTHAVSWASCLVSSVCLSLYPCPSLLLSDVMSLSLSGSSCLPLEAEGKRGGQVWEDSLPLFIRPHFVPADSWDPQQCKSLTAFLAPRIKWTVFFWLFFVVKPWKSTGRQRQLGRKSVILNCCWIKSGTGRANLLIYSTWPKWMSLSTKLM